MLIGSAENNYSLPGGKYKKLVVGIFVILTTTVIVFSILNLFSFVLLKPLPHCGKLTAFILILSVFSPRGSLLGLITLLPIMGNKPSSPQAMYLILISSSLILGVLLNLSYKRFFCKSSETSKVFSESIYNPVVISSFFYIIASVLSLSSLPFVKLINELRVQFPEVSGSNILGQWYYFLSLIEDKLPYSILSVMFSLQAFLISMLFLYYAKTYKGFLKKTAITIVISLFLTTTIGLLDYYQLLDLHYIRELDPIVNPNNIQFRLQSFFGHSGWFAEFIILSAPFVLLLYSTKLSFYIKTTLVIVILSLAQFALILSFQRGGWISIPITLIVIWSFIFISYQHYQYQLTPLDALKKSWLAIVISFPLTFLLAIAITWVVVVTGVIKSDREIDFSSYVGRFSDIQNTEDRTNFIKAGTLIGSLQPIFGTGSESFCIQFDKEFVRRTGIYYRKYNLPLHGTAHNVFVQTFSGKGLVGLTFLLIILGYLFISGIKAFRDKEVDYNTLLTLTAGSCFAVSFTIYGLVQEIFYIQSLQILVFVIFGLVASQIPNRYFVSVKTISLSFLSIFVFLIAHLLWVFIYPKHPKVAIIPLVDYGCYAREVNSSGERYSWCASEVKKIVEVKKKNGRRYFDINVKTEFLKPGQSLSSFLVEVADKTLLEAVLEPHRRYHFKVTVPKSMTGLMLDKRHLKVTLRHNSYFIPDRVFKNSNDFRILSFQLY